MRSVHPTSLPAICVRCPCPTTLSPPDSNPLSVCSTAYGNTALRTLILFIRYISSDIDNSPITTGSPPLFHTSSQFLLPYSTIYQPPPQISIGIFPRRRLLSRCASRQPGIVLAPSEHPDPVLVVARSRLSARPRHAVSITRQLHLVAAIYRSRSSIRAYEHPRSDVPSPPNLPVSQLSLAG